MVCDNKLVNVMLRDYPSLCNDKGVGLNVCMCVWGRAADAPSEGGGGHELTHSGVLRL